MILKSLLDRLGLDRELTLVMHDWGGIIGMTFAARHPERIARLVVSNTAAFHKPAGKSFPWALSLFRDTPMGSWTGPRSQPVRPGHGMDRLQEPENAPGRSRRVRGTL